MNTIWLIAASFFGAVLSAMGMGGGGILLIYLTVYTGMGQHKAQGINLLFFLPIAAIAILLHHKDRLIRWRTAGRMILFAIPGVAAGFWAARSLKPDYLSKIFAIFILIIGIREVLSTFTGKN